MDEITQERKFENYFVNAKEELLQLESDIIKAERHLALLTEGGKHESVYQAFRAVVFFTCTCMDDLTGAATTYGDKWEEARPRAKTNPYRHPIDFVVARSGIHREEIKGSDTLCRWATIAEAVHPIITDGTITCENFIDAICNRHGGIRGYYDRLTHRKGKRTGRGTGTGNRKTMTSADADKLFQKNFDKVKANQAGENNERSLVAVVFDIANSKTYPNLTTMKARFSPRDIKEVLLIQAIDETVLGIMQEGEEADA